MVDAAAMDAVFKYVDERFPVCDKTIALSADKDLSTIAKTLRDLIEKRNRLIAALLLPDMYDNTINSDGSAVTLFDTKALEALEKKLLKTEIRIDIGGESDTGGLINFNTDNNGWVTKKCNPRLLIREGKNAGIPVGNNWVWEIRLESTPITPATAKEIARVIWRGGSIHLKTPGKDEPGLVVKELQKAGKIPKVTQRERDGEIFTDIEVLVP